MLKCCGHEFATTDVAPKSFDSAKYAGKMVQEALVTVEGGPLRFTVHGEEPDDATKLGHLLQDGAVFRVYGPDIDNFRYQQSGAVAASVNVSYFNNA